MIFPSLHSTNSSLAIAPGFRVGGLMFATGCNVVRHKVTGVESVLRLETIELNNTVTSATTIADDLAGVAPHAPGPLKSERRKPDALTGRERLEMLPRGSYVTFFRRVALFVIQTVEQSLQPIRYARFVPEVDAQTLADFSANGAGVYLIKIDLRLHFYAPADRSTTKVKVSGSRGMRANPSLSAV